MQTGEAAGFAAALSQKLNTTPGQLDSDILIRKLVENGDVLTMLNDVSVESGEPWFAAIQYFGTKGFFRGYDAFPNEKLDNETASVWVAIFRKLTKGKEFDPNSEANKLPKIEPKKDSCLSMAKFATLLKNSGKFSEKDIYKTINSMPSIQLANDSITRGNACLVMYQLLKNI
jgi:hypothetical protein